MGFFLCFDFEGLGSSPCFHKVIESRERPGLFAREGKFTWMWIIMMRSSAPVRRAAAAPTISSTTKLGSCARAANSPPRTALNSLVTFNKLF